MTRRPRWLQTQVVGTKIVRRQLLASLARSLSLAALVYLLISVLPACRRSPHHLYITSAQLEHLHEEPTVRVRVVTGTDQVRLDGPYRLRLRSLDLDTIPVHEWAFATPVEVSRRKNLFVIKPSSGQSMAWEVDRLRVLPEYGSTIRVEDTFFPQQIVLETIGPGDGARDRFDVINHVMMEDYLPAVLAHELYRDWPAAVFEAQAVAARSYAIVKCAENWRRHFDLESTTTDQVYGGSTAHATARSAVKRTRGLILSFQDATLPAYYSSCCGGTGQDAAVAFPKGPNIRPLWGKKHSTWCAISPHYRWGPIVRSRADLSRRLAAWGKKHQHPIAALESITAVTATETGDTQRPGSLVVTDVAGGSFAMRPESFRVACNHQDPSLPPITSVLRIKSSDVDVAIEGDKVRLTGAGFGHGVGMCQWGAYGMAKRGHDSETILSFYYPGAVLEKSY